MAKRSLLGIAIVAFLLLVSASLVRPYGWFIDELYYLACARRLAFGYVDHPPLSIFLLAVVRAVAGDSLVAVRALAALVFAGNVFLVGALAHELGGSAAAQRIAAVSFVTGTGLLVMGSFYSMNVLELVAWTAIALLLARALRQPTTKRFLVLGVVIGLALSNKHTSATFVAALVAGIAATKERRLLATPGPWIAAGCAVVVVLPNVLWQATNDWPSIEFYRTAQALKNVYTPPLAAVADQILLVGPVGFVLAAVGTISGVRATDRRRVFAIAFALLFVVMITSGSSRPDRIAGAYPIVFATGAIATERFAIPWMTAAVVTALPLLFIGLPLLPPEDAAAYAKRLGVVPQIEKKSGTGRLPQWLADRLGWEAYAERVGRTVAELPPEERDQAVVITGDYGHAGALDLFGPRYGITRVISDHNNYWLWSRAVEDAPVLVAVDWSSERRLRERYEEVEAAGTFQCEWCLPSRTDLPIFVARHPRRRLAELWPSVKHFE